MIDLEKRHLAELTFSEVSRALRALSSTYVERRHALAEGAALSGAGKRAAFALFYGPLHFLLIRHIFQQLSGGIGGTASVIDLGCGTGAAGAAIGTRYVVGVDRNAWALDEAARTYRMFGLDGVTRRVDAGLYRFPNRFATVVAGFTMNEMAEASRDALLARLLERGRITGDRVLVVEPLARGAARWWDSWRQRFERAGGRSDEWRIAADLPEIVAKLDRAAGLRHRELTGRSLWLAPTSAASPAASS
jgi:SAM-dependent methyltransferase